MRVVVQPLSGRCYFRGHCSIRGLRHHFRGLYHWLRHHATAAILLVPLLGPLLELCRQLCLLENSPHCGAVIVDTAQAGVALVTVMLLEKALQFAQGRVERGLFLAVACLDRALLCDSHNGMPDVIRAEATQMGTIHMGTGL